MESDDGESIKTTSTDTSMFLRELQALNTSAEGAVAGVITTGQSFASDTIEVTGSGDAGDSQTLTQALKTMIGGRPKQIINLEQKVEEGSATASVYSPEVEVYAAPTDAFSSSGSNKVKIIPVVNHQWDHKYYCGNLVAVHRDAQFMGYVLKGKTAGNVRVLSRKTAHRTLLKAFKGQVTDIAFALSDDVYLAAVDESGTFFVYAFTMEAESIATNLILHIEREKAQLASEFRQLTRVIWCPYIPEDDNDADSVDPAKMLVLLCGTQAEVWNVDTVYLERGPGPFTVDAVSSGLMVVDSDEPTMPVVNAAFAPDGSAIAMAYQSGIVKFFLVDLDTSKTECMYDWNPHNGHPVTSLFFLDDHKHQVSDLQLWKFALTGAKQNTEIKLWSCETWACVQTLNFLAPIQQPDLQLQFKAEIDLSSRYFALSDIQSKVLYILQVHQNYSNSTAHISSVSMFPLAQPCLSFAIYDAGAKRLGDSANETILDEGEVDFDEDQNGENGVGSGSRSGVQVKMYGVHARTMQELTIRYCPETSVPDLTSASSLSQEEAGLRDLLSDVSLDQSEASQDLIIPAGVPLPSVPQPFSVSSPSVKPGLSQEEASRVSLSSTSSFTEVTAMNEDLMAMDSPRSSVVPSSAALSPASVFAKTPSKTDSSPSVKDPVLSLSNLPLPPISSKSQDLEEEDLSEERSSEKTPALVPSNLASSAIGGGDGAATTGVTSPEGGDPSDDHGIVTPRPVFEQTESLASSNKSGQDILAEMFQAARVSAATSGAPEEDGSERGGGLGDSLETASSTGSFPVGSLMKSLKSTNVRYDEDDMEVAEALGLEKESEDAKEEIEEVIAEEAEAEQGEEEASEDRSKVVWPDPPDVSTEAKRLVDEALEQGAEEEEVKGFEEDENDEGEVEEIIQQSTDDTEDYNADDDIDDIDVEERPHRPEPGQTHHTKALKNIDEKVSSLFDQLRQQQEMMLKMQEELQHQRGLQTQLRRHQVEQQQLQEAVEAQQSGAQSSLEQDVSRLEDVLASRMEHSLAQHMQRETKKFEEALQRSDAQRKHRDENLHMTVMHEVAHSVKNTLADTLRTEIKQTVNPALHRFVEPMKDKIHQEVAHRLTACDTLLKDNIAKAVKSRSTMDMLATSIGDVMYQHLQQAYTDSFRTAMLPSYKDALEKSVRDVHGIFQQGTKEYQLYMRQTVDQMLKERIATDELVTRMETAEKQFGQSVTQMKAVVLSSVRDELGGQVAQAVASLKGEIVSDVRKLLREEMGQALQEHEATISNQLNSYLRSGAGTPVTFTSEEETGKERILRGLRSGRVNEAFQAALSVGNIDMVVFACESAKPLDIFAQTPFPLTQPVLLSLISQLSANLEKNFDLKIKYLEDAVMSLDPSQPTSSEHIPNVVGGLVSSLQNCDAHAGDARKMKTIRMLIMAGKSLLS